MGNVLKQTIEKCKIDSHGSFQFLCCIGRFSIIGYLKIKKLFYSKITELKYKNHPFIKNIMGAKMYFDLRDKGISRDLLVCDIREPLAIEALRKEIKKGDIIIDIGANIGYYVLLESRLVGKKGKIYAIEPVPQNVEILKKNIKLNKYTNIEISQLAMGDKNEEGVIYVSGERNKSSMIFLGSSSNDFIETAKVKVMTLDEFLENKPYPNFIRMDVEGYEYEIIKGMEKTLGANKPLKLFMEIHPPYLGKKLIDLLNTLEQYNFRFKIGISEPPFVNPRSLSGRILKFLSKKIESKSYSGYFYVKNNDELKEFLVPRKICPQILFERP
jgi:FkbM family methyltransferase